MAYRKPTVRQLRQVDNLVREFTGDVITISGPHPESGLMLFSYVGRDHFGGIYVGRKAELLTGAEAGWPDPAEFMLRGGGAGA